MKQEILPVFTPPTQINVRKYGRSEKLWAGLFYKFYYKYNSFKMFMQDDADTGVKVMSNTVKKPSSETNSGKKTTLSKFTLKSSNTNNVIIYTSNLQKLGGKFCVCCPS